MFLSCQLSSVQSLSRVRLFAAPWTAAHQASLSITNSQSLLKLMSVESVMPSKHLILCHPLLLLPSIFPASGAFPRSQFFASGGQSIGASASASVVCGGGGLVAKSCPTLCSPMDCSTPGFPVHHQLTELAQTHVR